MNNCFICEKDIDSFYNFVFNLRFCCACFNIWQDTVQFTLVNMPQPGALFFKEYNSAKFDITASLYGNQMF